MNRCKWCNLKNELYISYHDDEWGILNINEEYLYEINRTIGSMSFNSRMNFGIDDTVYSINKVLMELNGSDSEASLAKKLASKAKPIIADTRYEVE